MGESARSEFSGSSTPSALRRPPRLGQPQKASPARTRSILSFSPRRRPRFTRPIRSTQERRRLNAPMGHTARLKGLKAASVPRADTTETAVAVAWRQVLPISVSIADRVLGVGGCADRPGALCIISCRTVRLSHIAGGSHWTCGQRSKVMAHG